jgi:hypothetical protein
MELTKQRKQERKVKQMRKRVTKVKGIISFIDGHI